MTKLLLDQGLPRGAAGLLRNHGWDAQHVGELDMSRAPDDAILRFAQAQNRVVVTLDADFHTLLVMAEASGPSVLRIRMQGLKAEQVTALIERVLVLAGDELSHGAMVTLSEGKVRVKRLPIVK